MRAVIQRVSSASVAIDGLVTAQIGRGLFVLLGVQTGDAREDAEWLAAKIANLRIFSDAEEKMNLSLLDLDLADPRSEGRVLVVSQFTLIASTRKGNRPSFNNAAKPAEAVPLYEGFLRELEKLLQRPVAKGMFGAMMQVGLVNDGPVTIIIDSKVRE